MHRAESKYRRDGNEKVTAAKSERSQLLGDRAALLQYVLRESYGKTKKCCSYYYLRKPKIVSISSRNNKE